MSIIGRYYQDSSNHYQKLSIRPILEKFWFLYISTMEAYLSLSDCRVSSDRHYMGKVGNPSIGWTVALSGSSLFVAYITLVAMVRWHLQHTSSTSHTLSDHQVMLRNDKIALLLESSISSGRFHLPDTNLYFVAKTWIDKSCQLEMEM